MISPIENPGYGTAVIYSIVCYPTGDTYIGSTIDLDSRIRAHRANSKDGTSPLYKRIREIGIEHFQIEILSIGGVDSIELRQQEADMISILQPSLNTTYPTVGAKYIPLSGGASELSYYQRKKLKKVTSRWGSKADFCNAVGITPLTLNAMLSTGMAKRMIIDKTIAALKTFK